MNIVLAAIDDSAAARPVLEVARALADLLGADLEAVHVEETPAGRTAAEVAAAAHCPCEMRRGDVVRELAAAVRERDAVVLVVGARGLPSGAKPAGHVTLDLAARLDVGMVVVPPDVHPGPMRRLLVAVEGDGESSALRRLVRAVRRDGGPQVVALHVFEPDALPMFGDQPVLETEAWAEEFERRTLRGARSVASLELRVGDAARVLRETALELDADLMVLDWDRSLEAGRARIVRSLLEESRVPVLLFARDRRHAATRVRAE